VQPQIEEKPEPGPGVLERSDLCGLRLTLDTIPAMVHSAQPDGSCDYFNQRWLDYLGVSLDDINGWKWTSRIHPEDVDAFVQKFRSSIRVGEPFEAKARVRRQDGVYRWMLHRKVPLRDEHGKIIKWYGSSIDIDELKRSEYYLAEGQRLSHVGSWTFNSAGFDHWSSELFKIHGLDSSAKAPRLEEYLALVHREDREFVVETIQKMFAEGRGFDFTKRIVRPDGETRRVRCVGVPSTHGGTFREFVGTGIDVTEQEQLTEELRRSEFYLAEGQRLAHAGSWSFKPDLTCDYWSRELYEILGFDPQNGIPTIPDYLTRIHPQDREIVEATIRRMIAAGEGCDLKKRIIRPDGVQRVIRCVGMAVRENEVVTRFVGTLMDITEPEELTEELRRREASLAEAQRLSHAGSFGWNVITGERTWSEENYRILDYDRSIKPTFELVRDRVHPDDLRIWEEAFARASEGKQVDFEHRLLMPDGSVKHLHVVAYGAQKDGKFVELIGTARDITERKRAEEAIRRSEAFLAEGQRLSRTGSWGWNAFSGKVTWSQEHFQILGLDPKETNASLDVFWERVHPDDRTGVQRAFESAIREKRNFEREFRIVTPDWSIRHLHGVGHAILNKANELVEFIGSTMDITERKRAEQRAQSQREAIRLALNAFVEKLDVNRFLGDVIAELNQQCHANSWELWLLDDSSNSLLLHSSSHGSESFSPAIGSKNARPLEELRGLWPIKDTARAPQILEVSSQKSLLSGRHGELLTRRGIKTLMIVPLVLGEQNLGFIELHFQSQTQFSSDDLELAQALVNHATLALQLNRLTRRAEQLAVTEERNRLAREIHDTLAQAFAGVVLHSEVLGASLAVSKQRCAKALSQIQKLARSGLEEARRSVQALRPKALDGNTLPEALRQAAIRLNDDAKLSCQFRQRGKKIHLSGEIQNELFRIGQEALTNVVKHAQAKSVWITLVSQARRVSLSIKDDGIGFATAKPQDQDHGFGMRTMRERAQGIGGRLRVESRPGSGTTIRVEVPSPANRSKKKVTL
jgi:PAS domain S-box-containing protein